MLCLSVLNPVASYAAKWKDVPQELLALQRNPYDPGSGALIIFDEGNMTLVERKLEVYRRVKVFTDEGKKYASVKVWFQNSESVHDIKARVIFSDGRTLDMPSTDVLTEHLSEGSGVIKFTIPGVTTGSILEFKYIKEIRYVEPWYFDSADYTLSSTITVKVPELYWYTADYVNLDNPPEMSQVKWFDLTGKGTTYTWSMKNRRAVREEPYSHSWENLRAGIRLGYLKT